MDKLLVIIDGSNFYHGSKNLCPEVHLTNFNYRKLVEKVVGQKGMRILYCVGEIKRESGNKKAEGMYAQQQSLFYNLEQQKIEVYKGFMLKSDGKYHEKGVDVKMAVEITAGALKNEYNVCYLISSDTDIVPAILEAKVVKKKIIYVGFEKKLSRAMMRNCTGVVEIKRKMIRD
ncbi:MAG: NYN domain-containing protein [Candidatus Shapirobacteria bacterium]|nr:NYN domain-containing protein [Candidatus Shapirobacteria bacterium]